MKTLTGLFLAGLLAAMDILAEPGGFLKKLRAEGYRIGAP